MTKLRESKEGLPESQSDLNRLERLLRTERYDLIEMYKVTSNIESVNCVKQPNLRKNLEQNQWLGHVRRIKEEIIPKVIVQGKVEGVRGRGKSRTSWASTVS